MRSDLDVCEPTLSFCLRVLRGCDDNVMGDLVRSARFRGMRSLVATKALSSLSFSIETSFYNCVPGCAEVVGVIPGNPL